MQNFEGAIFDLDGTLVDSMWVWTKIDLDFLGQRGLTVPDNIGKVTEGMSFTETATYFKETFELKETVEEIKELCIRMAVDYYSNEVMLKAGALDLLKLLKGASKKIGLATSCSRELLQAVLQQHSLEEYFDTIVTSCEVAKGKPFPDVFLKAADNLLIAPDQIIAFEDTVAGVMAAKAAGMTVVGLYDEYSRQHQNEIEEKADYYCHSLEEFYKKIIHS